MTHHTLIKNAQLVNEGEIFQADVLIKNDRIEKIGADLKAPQGTTVVDRISRCRGRWHHLGNGHAQHQSTDHQSGGH